jgi:hypothetical protein
MGERKKCTVFWVRKSEGYRQLRRSRSRWEYNNRMDLKQVALGVVDWMILDQDGDQWRTLVNTIMKLRVP